MKDYKDIWNNLSTNYKDASHYVCCVSDEEGIRSNGKITADFLKSVLVIEPTDTVLEIGCGVARIGKELAPYCKEWHGADISSNMIKYAAERVTGIDNIYLHELPESDLSIFPDDYFDCVYSSIVFMHLDKLDMFTYIKEAFRVLAPGGRAYFDTYNILSPDAWQEFLRTLSAYPPGHRPGHVSQFSTPQELTKFLEEVGFEAVHVDGSDPQLVLGLGRKPGGPTEERPSFSFKHVNLVDRSGLPDGDKFGGPGGTIEATRQYAKELEAAVALKNKHITQLEALIRKQQQEIARMQSSLPMRLSRTLARKKNPTGSKQKRT